MPQDPAIEPIFRRAVAQLDQIEDRFTRTLIQTFAVPYLRELDELGVQRASHATMPHRRRGKCDFCGRAEQAVRVNFDTELRDSAGRTRFALICKDCE